MYVCAHKRERVDEVLPFPSSPVGQFFLFCSIGFDDPSLIFGFVFFSSCLCVCVCHQRSVG